MDKSVFLLCKQNVVITRLHICTWNINHKKYFTEYGIEINRNNLTHLDIALALPQQCQKKDFVCLYENIITPNNSRFIFNSDITKTSPINGDTRFGVNISLGKDRDITVLPLEGSVAFDMQMQKITIEIPSQAHKIIYLRFLVKSEAPSFSFIKRGISKINIIYDVRVNDCRTASKDVINAQKNGYHLINIEKCFCFHIIPNSFSLDFIQGNKLKTIRGLEDIEFNEYLGDSIRETEKIKLKEQEYNIVFCKQENKTSYSFFSVYSKDFIGTPQIILALAVNIICSLLFAAGGLHTQVYNMDLTYIERIPWEYWTALGVLIVLLIVSIIYITRKK